MADFSTHLVGATAVSSLAATVLAKVLELPADTSLLLVGAGILGGILPDIDLQQSTPARLLFTVLGALLAILSIFANLDHYSALVLWGMGLGVFCTLRWPLAWVFGAVTVHRGSLHSLLACASSLLVATSVSHQVFDTPALTAWLLGFFTALGYLLHLLLDELWSVDFAGVRVKRSFGSALKPVDMQRWAGSVVLLFICLGASSMLPPTDTLLETAETLIAAVRANEPGVLLPKIQPTEP